MSEVPKLEGRNLDTFRVRGKRRDLTKFKALMETYQGTGQAYPLDPILRYLDISLYTLRSWCKSENVTLNQRTDSEGTIFVAFS